MEGQPTYAAINGKEARQILKHDANEKIDKIPLFKEGAAFHRIHIIYTMVCTCYPADCPVPTLDFEIARSAKGFDEQKDFVEKKDKITTLEAKRKELEDGIIRIDQILSVIRPIIEIGGNLSAGDIPDELRIAHNLPVPRIITSTDIDGNVSKAEKYIIVTADSK